MGLGNCNHCSCWEVNLPSSLLVARRTSAGDADTCSYAQQTMCRWNKYFATLYILLCDEEKINETIPLHLAGYIKNGWLLFQRLINRSEQDVCCRLVHSCLLSKGHSTGNNTWFKQNASITQTSNNDHCVKVTGSNAANLLWTQTARASMSLSLILTHTAVM